jgi:two-component system, NarL family, sensor histidine kinase YdfH
MRTNPALARRIAIPFYLFISLMLGLQGSAAVREVWSVSGTGTAVLTLVLIAAFISLFWIRYALAGRNVRWWLFYYPAQAILMVAIMLLLNGRSSVQISFLYPATVCLVVEALGVWGNSRRALLIAGGYVVLLIGLLFVFAKPAQIPGSLLDVLINGGVIILFMVVLNQQFIERQKAVDLAESLESANAKLAASAARIEALTLQNERQRLARELHDTLAQGVAGEVLQLEAIKAHLAANRPERAAAVVELAIVRARATLAESRAAIDDLRSLPADLGEAVRQQVEHFQQSTGIPCTLEVTVSKNQFPNEITNHALNILSESLTNILRHAQATRVQVKFLIREQTLELEVRDNGKGFDVHQSSGGHYGLIGMQERARLAGGRLDIDSNAGGTCIHFRIGGDK